MAELQTGTAILTIAELAVKATRLLRRVISAPSEAEKLCRRTQGVADLANIVEQVIEHRSKAHGDLPWLRVESSIHESIKNSLKQCRQSLTFINIQLQPFENAEIKGVPPQLADRYKFVRSSGFVQDQENILEKQMANLTLSFNLLSSFDMLILRNEYTRGILAKKENSRQDTAQERLSLSRSQGPNGLQETIGFNVEDSVIDGRHLGDAATLMKQAEQTRYPRDSAAKCPHCCGIAHVSSGIAFEGADNWTPLHYAAKSLDYNTLKALLDCPEFQGPAFLDAVSSRSETALMLTATHADDPRSIHLAAALIEKQCKVNVKDSLGRSALYHALDGPPEKERVDFVKLLIEHGAEVRQMRRDYPGKLEKFERSRLFAESSLSKGRRRSSTIKDVRIRKDSIGDMASESSNSISELTRSRTEPMENESGGRRNSLKQSISAGGTKFWRGVLGSGQAPMNRRMSEPTETRFSPSQRKLF